MTITHWIKPRGGRRTAGVMATIACYSDFRGDSFVGVAVHLGDTVLASRTWDYDPWDLSTLESAMDKARDFGEEFEVEGFLDVAEVVTPRYSEVNGEPLFLLAYQD